MTDYKCLISDYNIRFLCLLETKLHFDFAHDRGILPKLMLFRDKGFVENFSCCIGGHILLKRDSSLSSFNPLVIIDQFIHDEVNLGNSNSFLLTSIYVSNDSLNKIYIWNMLKYLAGLINSPWLVIGDFNLVLYAHEKVGATLCV